MFGRSKNKTQTGKEGGVTGEELAAISAALSTALQAKPMAIKTRTPKRIPRSRWRWMGIIGQMECVGQKGRV